MNIDIGRKGKKKRMAKRREVEGKDSKNDRKKVLEINVK